jgi:hypothetical protein
MAYAIITITGTILAPDGVGVVGGYIEYTLNAVGSVSDAATHVILGTSRTPIRYDGTVNFTIVANADITPAGTRYAARIVPEDGEAFVQEWVVPASPATQDIGDISV